MKFNIGDRVYVTPAGAYGKVVAYTPSRTKPYSTLYKVEVADVWLVSHRSGATYTWEFEDDLLPAPDSIYATGQPPMTSDPADASNYDIVDALRSAAANIPNVAGPHINYAANTTTGYGGATGVLSFTPYGPDPSANPPKYHSAPVYQCECGAAKTYENHEYLHADYCPMYKKP